MRNAEEVSDSEKSEGELSSTSEEAPLPVKKPQSKYELWKNVVEDLSMQDAIGSINTFGSTSDNPRLKSQNRSVESYDFTRAFMETEKPRFSQGRKRKAFNVSALVDNDNMDHSALESNVYDSKRSRRNYSGVCESVENSCDENDLDKELEDYHAKGQSKFKQIPEDLPFEEVLSASCQFLERMRQNEMQRPTMSCSFKELQNYLCWALNETNKCFIGKLVQMCPYEKCMQYLDETVHIEKEGGLMTNSGTRKRLPGGIFISVVKKNLTSKLERQFLFHSNAENFLKYQKHFAANLKKKKQRQQKRRKGRIATTMFDDCLKAASGLLSGDEAASESQDICNSPSNNGSDISLDTDDHLELN